MFTSDHGDGLGTAEPERRRWRAHSTAPATPTTTAARPANRRPSSRGDYQVVGGGGSGTIYVEDEEDRADIAQLVSDLPGVDFIATP